MLGIKIGIADGAQSDGRGNAADIWLKAADGGRGRVVVQLVFTFAEDPCLGVQHAGAGQIQVVRGDFGARGGVAHRVEANTEIAGRDRQAVAAAGDGYGAPSYSRTGAIIVSAKDHVAGGDRRGRAHRDVFPSHCCHVAGTDRRRRRNGHIVHCGEGEHAGRRLGGCSDVDVVTGLGIHAAVDARNGLIYVDVVHSLHGQGGGCGPGHGVVDIDIAKRARTTRGALNRYAGGIQVGAELGARDVAAPHGHGVIHRVNQPEAGLPGARQRGDSGVVSHLHMRR